MQFGQWVSSFLLVDFIPPCSQGTEGTALSTRGEGAKVREPVVLGCLTVGVLYSESPNTDLWIYPAQVPSHMSPQCLF